MLWEKRARSGGVPVPLPSVLQMWADRAFGAGMREQTEMRSLRPAGTHGTYVHSGAMMATVDPAGTAMQGGDQHQVHSAKRAYDTALQGTGKGKGGGQALKRSKGQEVVAKVQAAFDMVQCFGPSRSKRRRTGQARMQDHGRAILSAKTMAAAVAIGIAVLATVSATWASGLGESVAAPKVGTSRRWVGGSFNQVAPPEAL